MARVAITGMLRTAGGVPIRNSQGGVEIVVAGITDPGTSGNLFISFDNTVFTSVSDLRNAAIKLVDQLVGSGGLTP